MTTNLTIELDNNLLESLNQYAKSRGRTVSEILEGQLRKLVQIQSKRKTTPVSSKLRGVVKLPKDFDYKKEMEEMKHYFVDTNVVIDMLADREGYADAACELFDAAGRGEVHLSICALSYSTIYYILRKYAGKENAISSLRDLTDYVSILPVDAEVIRKALYSEFSDYEDAIQHYAALQDASVEGIITRNIKDYRYSDIPVLLPTEFHK